MADEAIDLTSRIVASFLSNHSVAVDDLPALIHAVHRTLNAAASGGTSDFSKADAAAPKDPAVTVRRSITPDYLVCLEDGQKFKSLKRHLRTAHDLDPVGYRAKWGLKRDYPMVAPNYSEARSALARSIGLGQKGRQGSGAKGPAPDVTPAKAPAKRSRRANAEPSP